MADPVSAWGIDIGQAGLKAIRLRATDDSQKVFAAAFDYVPHPKILSQPDAVPEELIREAMKTFLERNKVDGDVIAISVPGQNSLAKFIKLPPVESSKVAEIVRYEARQQIPFDLNDVIWDYQPIGGGVEESGFMLEAEVGLFAMKKELVNEAMRPYVNNRKEVEIVQIAPLALYNLLSYDVLGFRKTAENPEPPASEDYYVVLDMGADNTTLLVSNGRSIWIRNVPIGGNHFTRALTKDMKLTFAKAEHLKCNATKAPDPKAVFQAMRPVFNDYVTEIQRSIGFFGSVNRSAKIRKVIGVGNGFKLAGLQKFLQQNLQYEVERLDSLNGASGDAVLTDPLFVDNIMTFAVPYGLALQGLKKTRIRTSLLPPEIAMDRKIRAKKPWAIAAAAGLLAAMGIGTIGSAGVLSSYGVEKWQAAQDVVKNVQAEISAQDSAYTTETGNHKKTLDQISQLTAPLEKRSLWMELFKAVNECLPYDEGDALDQTDITLQKKLRISSITAKRVADVVAWHKGFVPDTAKDRYFLDAKYQTPPAASAGYIVTLKGFHFYNNTEVANADIGAVGMGFVENTLIHNLRQWTLNRNGVEIPVGRIGISYPVLAAHLDSKFTHDPNQSFTDASMTGGGMMGGIGGMMGGMMGGLGAGSDEEMSSEMSSGMAGAMAGAMGGMGGGYPGGGIGAGGLAGGVSGGEGALAGGYPPGAGYSGGPPGAGNYPPGAGYPGGMAGGLAGGIGTGGLPGAGAGQAGIPGSPMFEEKKRGEVREVERTDFVVQFIWVPTIERDRKAEDPSLAKSAGTTGQPAAPPATP
jgi:type IV pilus assembly protein PilM